MTVKDLIQELRGFPPDAELIIADETLVDPELFDLSLVAVHRSPDGRHLSRCRSRVSGLTDPGCAGCITKWTKEDAVLTR